MTVIAFEERGIAEAVGSRVVEDRNGLVMVGPRTCVEARRVYVTCRAECSRDCWPCEVVYNSTSLVVRKLGTLRARGKEP